MQTSNPARLGSSGASETVSVESSQPVKRGLELFATMPRRFVAALGVGLAFIVLLAVDQSHWWRMRPDYAFGWVVPAFVAYVVSDRLPRMRENLRAGGPSPLPRWLASACSILAGLILVGGVAVFLAGAAYRAGEGPSQPATFVMALGFACIILGMVYHTVPDGRWGSEKPRGIFGAFRSDARLRVTALFLFPALVWLISAPLASAVENAVSLYLLRKVVAVVFTIFSALGLPILQQGNVLILPHGQVGVADACSGIRSLTGCLFAGSFLAAVYLDRLWKKVLLVAAAMGFAFLTNLLRSLFLTAWAYAYGSDAIEGPLHDGTGFAVLGLTCVGLFCLIPLFQPRRTASGGA